MNFDSNYRFYMGRHLIYIISRCGRKAHIIHRENGYVGNKREGYKQVVENDDDIVLVRHCHKTKKAEGK